MQTCPKCNKFINDDNANFCSNCGITLPSIKQENIEETQINMIEDKPVLDLNNSLNIENSESELKPLRKWGWGWYILFGFLFLGYKNTSNVIDKDSTLANIGFLIGITIGLTLYFYIRKNYFKKFKEPWTRSFTSGIISYFIAALIMSFIRAAGRPM